MDLLHTTALSNLALFGGYTAVVGLAALAYGARVRRKAAQKINDLLSEVDDLVEANNGLYLMGVDFVHESVAADQRATNAEAIVEELKADMADISQELAAAKVEMTETNAVCDAYAKQCQRTDDVVDHLAHIVQLSGVAYLSTSDLIEAQTESLIRVGLRKEATRGPGTIGRASDLELAA